MSSVIYIALWWAAVFSVAAKPTANSRDVLPTQICGALIDEVNEGSTILWASDAYECLKSVPFNPAPALRFIDYYNTTLQFQSTLKFLKDPPEGYQQPAIDVEGVLARIKANVTAGLYQNEYDFESDVQDLVYAIHDAHVDLRAGILAPFSFGSPYYISSVSEDGKKPPKVYFTDDIIHAQNDQFVWTPSPIATIQGEEVVSYLTKFASRNSVGMLEKHAEWNDLMGSPTQDILGARNLFAGDATFYPGDDLTFTFENGTDPIETFWLALYNYQLDTGPLTTGGDFYNFFVLGLQPSTDPQSIATPVDSSTVARKLKRQEDPSPSSDDDKSWATESFGAYSDSPDVAQPDLLINGGGVLTGYFLKDISVAVLSIPTFEQFGDYIDSFSTTVQNFIDEASANNMQRVVIDVQQNRGGVAVLAFDTFSRFFPQTEPFGGSRRRSHPMGNAVGKATTDWWNTLDPNNDTEVFDWALGLADEWVIPPRLDAETGTNFPDWGSYQGRPGDEFTRVEKYNLSDVDFDYEALGTSPYAHGDKPANTTAHWDSKDIIILTDGLCSSTCSLFVEFMTRVGVRTVVIGGSPSTGPMQAVSGSRGAASYWAEGLDVDLTWAGMVDEEANRTLPNIPPNREFRDSGIWTSFAGINLRDQIREKDLTNKDAVPLQFEYEAADCRIYFTMRNLYNMTQQWRDASAASWIDPNLCVEGSTGYSTTGKDASSKKPPVPVIADQYLPFKDVHLQGDGSSATSKFADIGDGNDLPIQAGPRANPKDVIVPCKVAPDGSQSCDGKLKCVSVNVQCHKSAKTAFVNACLPLCDDTPACRQFDTNLGLGCDTFQPREQKASTKRTGNAALTVPTAQLQRSVWVGVCKPTFGTKILGNCPIVA